GERLIAVGALDSYAADLKKEGHPIKTLYPSDGVFVIPSPTSVVKNSPSPNAAKLFAEFMIGDVAQKIFPADGGYSSRIDIAAPQGPPILKQCKIFSAHNDKIEKERARIKRRLNEFFQCRRDPAPADSPFWRFSIGFYRDPAVAAACIALQDEADVDV